MASISTSRQSGILLDVGTNELEIIEFVVGTQHFGINVAKVKQVIRWDPAMLTTMHDAPPAIPGVIYHRGKPVTLVDLKIALGIVAEPVDESRQLVLVTQFNDNVTAFLVDKVSRIHRVSWSQLEPLKEMMPGITSYITGSVQVPESLILVLDLEHLMYVLTPRSPEKMPTIKRDAKRSEITILYAEDSAMIRRLTCEHLNSAGYIKLLIFENGLKAYDKMREFHKLSLTTDQPISHFVNLVLTDIEMPKMDGLTLCKSIKQDMGHNNLPVVVYSSLINDQMAKKCEAVGSNAHISKPNFEQIVVAIDRECGIGL